MSNTGPRRVSLNPVPGRGEERAAAYVLPYLSMCICVCLFKIGPCWPGSRDTSASVPHYRHSPAAGQTQAAFVNQHCFWDILCVPVYRSRPLIWSVHDETTINPFHRCVAFTSSLLLELQWMPLCVSPYMRVSTSVFELSREVPPKDIWGSVRPYLVIIVVGICQRAGNVRCCGMLGESPNEESPCILCNFPVPSRILI